MPPSHAPHPVSRARARQARARAAWHATPFSDPREETRYATMHRAEQSVLRWGRRCYTKTTHVAIVPDAGANRIGSVAL